ncbi:MAG: TIGR04283 family arsenosugar biosynthesis glycosyltransferase [Planctomycetaceae bacterium]|nr:TIGR04283 family arsenosugar biosynthesis glycosyltransferase [Planctomycetaceae bacterium]
MDSLSDLDRIEDLPVWKEVNRRNANHSGRTLITVVIPALNEADNLPATLTPLVTLADVEVIVADGGSIDDTCGVAQRYGARVACSAPGRGRQMNAGAAQASGEMLVFLHADTRLPDDFDKHVREILLQPGIAAGAFRLKIDGSSRAMRCVEWGANMRSRWLDLPFGDQAYFVSQEVFRQVGGFHEMPILEDVEFIRRLRYYGRIVIASATVVTSARRWQRLGVVKTTWRNVMILSAYFAGVSPFRLARWYQSTR